MSCCSYFQNVDYENSATMLIFSVCRMLILPFCMYSYYIYSVTVVFVTDNVNVLTKGVRPGAGEVS